MSRALWFAAGAGAGLYGALRARRLAYRFSPVGLADQVAALRLGAQTLVDDARTAAGEREHQLATELGLAAYPSPHRGKVRAGTAPVLTLSTRKVTADGDR